MFDNGTANIYYYFSHCRILDMKLYILNLYVHISNLVKIKKISLTIIAGHGMHSIPIGNNYECIYMAIHLH